MSPIPMLVPLEVAAVEKVKVVPLMTSVSLVVMAVARAALEPDSAVEPLIAAGVLSSVWTAVPVTLDVAKFNKFEAVAPVHS